MRRRVLGLGLVCVMMAVAAAPRAVLGAATVPDASQAIAAYTRVSAWVRAWTMPPRPEDDPFRIGAEGAAVTLRLGGRVLGRGTSVLGDGTDAHRATAEAWREASGRLLVEQDELALERIEILAQRVTIELELAGAMTPVPGETFDAAVADASPGRTGVGLRVGDRIEAVFPGVQMGTAISPSRALRAAAGAMGLPPVELGELRSGHGAAALRFETAHLAQVEPGAGPVFLHRGGGFVPGAEITGERLRSAAMAMARRLRENAWPDGGAPWGLRGDYRAITGQHDPAIATARTQALAALALVRFAVTPGIDAESTGEAMVRAGRILADLGVVTEEEDDPIADPVASALIAVAAPIVVGSMPSIERALDIGTLDARAAATIRTIAADGREAEAKPTTEERAVVAWALAVRAGQPGAASASDRSLAEALVRGLVREAGPTGLISASPWVPWAMMELHPTGDLPGSTALRDLRAAVWARQIGDAVSGTGDRDFEGGVLLVERAGGPTAAHTVRAIGALPAMLGDRRVTTDEEFLIELARVRRSLRFVVQLMFRAEEAFLARDPGRAIGGVRPSLWDPVVSVDATSMSLIVVCDALAAVRKRAGGPPPVNREPAEAPAVQDEDPALP